MKLIISISNYNRKRKFDYFMKTLQPTEEQILLDVGFCNTDSAPEAVNYLEKHYPYRHKITALGLEEGGKDLFETLYPTVKVVTYDGRVFPFEDNFFDIGWSNAVIEHVGKKHFQVLFVKEMLRTCKFVFLTTPNRKFPFDLHSKLPFIHWLPKKMCDKIMTKLGYAWATGDYMHLLTKKQIVNICREAGAKYIKVKRNRLLGFTIDFALIVSRFES